MIPPERVRWCNERPVREGRYVLYWMQAAQRARYNHALEYAIRLANERGKAVVVVFGLTAEYPDANWRHYAFMLQGLAETQQALAQRGVAMIARQAEPDAAAIELAAEADLVVVDAGHLRIQRQWRADAARRMDCPLIEVETNMVVPADVALGRAAWSAAVLRRRIERDRDRFLTPVRHVTPRHKSVSMGLEGLDLSDPESILKRLAVDRSVPPVKGLRGGPRAARRRLRAFLNKGLDSYEMDRNDPTLDGTSRLSPYLHFGQISPVEIALEVLRSGSPGATAFLEQLIVRRELGLNFVQYNAQYDHYAGLPAWARQTLERHRRDARGAVYGLEDLEAAGTEDVYWNAAQKQMMQDGYMHGYMRMYWGKRILEWTRSPSQAFDRAAYLNNKYELDGRDPNGWAGVAWCFGQHDRPWPERPVFGTVRFMNAAGLKRKFDADAYVRRVDASGDRVDK
ncbi:MAG TPA: deoxyribodipyrimidine photolyase [Phycisphaerales bacterium]|nr:deoxyribodipyrimidine photolyase [Phycisphaerales bacterium]